MTLLTLVLNSSSMAFRIFLIVAFIIPPDFTQCLVLTHRVLLAPSLVPVDVIFLISFVLVVMILWPLFGIGFFDLQLLVSTLDHWFCELAPLVLLKSFVGFQPSFSLDNPLHDLAYDIKRPGT